jgi:hypothetical protein
VKEFIKAKYLIAKCFKRGIRTKNGPKTARKFSLTLRQSGITRE